MVYSSVYVGALFVHHVNASEQDVKEVFTSDYFVVTFDIILSFLIFFAVSVIADELLVPVLQALAQLLRMPDNVAGVTLLALGNGAPDIFACRAGFMQGPEDASLGVGALLGAAMFDFLLVFSLVTLAAPQSFRNDAPPFLRDILFYVVSSSLLIYVSFYQQKLTLLFSLLFFALYVIYIAVVLFARCEQQEHTLQISSVPEEALSRPASPDADVGGGDMQNANEASTSLTFSNALLSQNRLELITRFEASWDGFVPGTPSDQSSLVLSGTHSLRYSFVDEVDILWHDLRPYSNDLCGSDRPRRWTVLLFNLFKFVVVWITKFFVHSPDCDGDAIFVWHRLTLAVQTFFGTVLLAFLIDYTFELSFDYLAEFPHGSHIPIVIYIIIGAFCGAVILFLVTKSVRPPRGYSLLLLYNFVICFLFTSYAVDFVVDKILDITHKIHFPAAIAGLTIVAWGNSLGDIVSNCAVSRNGSPKLGVSACFGGQLMNLLLGVCLAGILSSLQHSDEIIFERSSRCVILWICVLFGSFSLLFTSIGANFTHSKLCCFLHITLYFALLTIAVSVSLAKPHLFS